MAIELNELQKWLETEPGKKWSEAHKKGLVDKNNELLEKLKTANGELEKANGTIQKLEGDLTQSQAVINDTLLSKPLAEKLTQKGVFPVLIPELSKTISEGYALRIADGNAVGKVTENGKETVLSLDQIIESWAKSDKAKDCFKPRETETVSTGPDFKAGDKPVIDKELAALRRGAGLPEKE
jgi:hypothetical protein